LPLDVRQAYTKLDWTIGTATLTGNRADFEALVQPVHDFLAATPDRVPMTDWYGTENGRKVGFQARPVVGGVLLPLLYDAEVWRRWAGRDRTKSAGWAPLPVPPEIVAVVPTAQQESIVWRYTTDMPAYEWFAPAFDAAAWQSGPAGFGAGDPPGSVLRSLWNTPDIWLRREFDLPAGERLGSHPEMLSSAPTAPVGARSPRPCGRPRSRAERSHLAHRAGRPRPYLGPDSNSGTVLRPAAPGLPRRGRGDLRQRRAGRVGGRLRHCLRAAAADPGRPGRAEAGEEPVRGALPPDGRWARDRRGDRGRGEEVT
ncbi:MAG: DUF1793 domain-containing protein, partial [Armatimonadetes bacterium]|nr:DUF1793 domain-containing protein [Armatimonadota bacterium]